MIDTIIYLIKDRYYFITSYIKVFIMEPMKRTAIRLKSDMSNIIALLLYAVVICIIAVPFGAHVLFSLKAGAALMLIVGIVILPYGWLHGLGCIFGWWS